MSNTSQMAPITEDDIANYLANTHPHSQRAVSLQERQALMLREKIKSLEHRIMDMIRHGHENMVLTDKLHRWACDMLAAPAAELPVLAVENIRELFQVPQVALRLWDVADSSAAYAQGVSESVRTHAATLETPYVGPSQEVEAVQWLEAPAQAASVALMALRPAPGQDAFGLLVLASPDAQRFNSQMGTELLERLAQLAGAALSVLRRTPH